MLLNQKLLQACQGKSTRRIRLLLNKGADVDVQDYHHNSTPLHIAAMKGNVEAVQLLLENGADVDAKDIDHWTPLQCGVTSGHMKVVELLVKHGANINAIDDDNWTPLHCAVGNEHVEIANFLIKHGAGVNTRGRNNYAPLYWIINKEYTKSLFLLLLYNNNLGEEGRVHINNNPNLKNCLAAFEQIKTMPNLGGFIKKYNNKDRKAILKYIDENSVANRRALISEIEKCCSFRGELSFIPDCLCDFVEHKIHQALSEYQLQHVSDPRDANSCMKNYFTEVEREANTFLTGLKGILLTSILEKSM